MDIDEVARRNDMDSSCAVDYSQEFDSFRRPDDFQRVPPWEPGDRVRIARGILKGVEGTIVERRDDDRVLFAMGFPCHIEIQSQMLEPL